MVWGDFAAARGIHSGTDSAEGTLIVFGDSAFPSDRAYGRSYGTNLMLNMINYLTDDLELVAIQPKVARDAPFIRMTGSRWLNLLLLTFVAIPSVFLLIALSVYLARRRHG